MATILALAAAPARAQDHVLVVGGAGYLGAEISKALVARGFAVTVMVRPTSDRSRLAGVPVTFAVGDATKPDDVLAAASLHPFRAVVDAIAGAPGEAAPYAAAQTAIVATARATGVEQIVLNSSAGAGDGSNAADYPDINVARFKAGLIEKGRAEAILRTGSVPYTVVRSGAILIERGEPPHPPTGQAYLVEDEKVVGPTTYGDLGRLVAACVLNARCFNGVFHATDDTLGPEFKRWRCMRFRTSETEKC
ncbi:MAG: NAD(P)H-binding protein [Rhodospirillaceae bacterium]|nr:NAD(P)H-binding protein [Rhodospirillaceae bacterium]